MAQRQQARSLAFDQKHIRSDSEITEPLRVQISRIKFTVALDILYLYHVSLKDIRLLNILSHQRYYIYQVSLILVEKFTVEKKLFILN